MLVFGGSQGAHVLNELGVALLPRISSAGAALRWRHQTGPREHAEIAARYAAAGLGGLAVPYLDDMPSELADTDLCICRAGAMTVAELAASGTPAVLVPFAAATGGHQLANARAHAAAGAAWVVEEHELTPDRAWRHVALALEHPETLELMASRALGRAVPEAAARIIDRLEELS